MDQRTKALSVANTELQGEIERRKGLEGEILSVSDREQQRLGQELHDGLCQHLTAVSIHGSLYRDAFEKPPCGRRSGY